MRTCRELARLRNRWNSPQGARVSLQLLSSDLADALPLIELGQLAGPHTESTITGVLSEPCRPFDYPRTWTVVNEEYTWTIISFSWMHQGLACDGDGKPQLGASVMARGSSFEERGQLHRVMVLDRHSYGVHSRGKGAS